MSIVESKTIKGEPKAIPLDEIYADEQWNCRGQIIPIDVMDLARNMQEQGLIQPVIAIPYNKAGKKYKLVAGYRRFMAANFNKWDEIDAIIRHDLDEDSSRLLNLSENLNRQNLNVMQEAEALKHFWERGWTQTKIAEKLNVSNFWVQVRVAALTMPEQIQEEIRKGWLKQQDIMLLKGLPQDKQFDIVRELKERQASLGEKAKAKITKQSIFKNPHKAYPRNATQIRAMLDHLYDHLGNPEGATEFGYRALAWAAGNISSDDFYQDIKSAADSVGKDYDIPEEDIV